MFNCIITSFPKFEKKALKIDNDLFFSFSLNTNMTLKMTSYQLFTHLLRALIHSYSPTMLSQDGEERVLSSLPHNMLKWPSHSQATFTHFYVATVFSYC